MLRRVRNRLFGLLCGVVCLCCPAWALGQIHLSLEPAEVTVQPGEALQLQLWARSASPQTVDGAEVVLRWNQTLLSLVASQGNSANWSYSGFPEASPLNTDLADGEALYQCLAPLTGASPQTDVLLGTLQYVALQSSGVVSVTIPIEGATYVASGAADALDGVTGATVTIGSPGGGGGTDPGSGDGDPDDGGTTTDPGDDGTTTQPSDDGSEPGDGDDPGGNGSQTGARAPFCGAGAAEGMMASLAGLFFSGTCRRMRRAAGSTAF